MALSRRMLGWGGPVREWERDLLAHAEWLDRALHNGVLGTQRGSQPGAMLYMMPLGSGVRKGGGQHGYSNGESHFWCCMGSGIEAFTKLHASVFYRVPPSRSVSAPAGNGRASRDQAGSAAAEIAEIAELYVLQLISADLTWAEVGCHVSLQADQPGELEAGLPLTATLTLSSLRVTLRVAQPPSSSRRGHAGARRRGTPACALRVRMRVPGWAYTAVWAHDSNPY